MDNLTPQFIAGFYTGEGYFNIQNIPSPTGKVHKGFCIGLHVHGNDLALIRHIQSSMQGIGHVTIRKNTNIQYRIHKGQELEYFVEIISPFLKGNKAKQFRVWLSCFYAYKL